MYFSTLRHFLWVTSLTALIFSCISNLNLNKLFVYPSQKLQIGRGLSPNLDFSRVICLTISSLAMTNSINPYQFFIYVFQHSCRSLPINRFFVGDEFDHFYILHASCAWGMFPLRYDPIKLWNFIYCRFGEIFILT